MNARWWPWIWFAAGALASELVYQRGGDGVLRIVGVIVLVTFLLFWVQRRMDANAPGVSWGYPASGGFIAWALARFFIALANAQDFVGAA